MRDSVAPNSRYLLRAHRRVSANMPVGCELADGQETGARLRDVSLGGAFLELSQPLAFGDRVTVTVQLPGLREPSRLPAVVRWTRPDGVGVQWGLLGAQQTHAMGKLLAQLVERDDQPVSGDRPIVERERS